MLLTTPLGTQSLHGKRLVLERTLPEHATFLQQCYQDAAFMNLYRSVQKRDATVTDIAERLAKEQNYAPQQLRRLEWIINRYDDADHTTKTPLGLAALADLQLRHQRAEFLVGIQDTSQRRSGLALEASLLVLDFAFNQARLNKLVVFVYSYNADAQANALSLGFQQEGYLKKHIHVHHQFVDLYMDGLTVEDFRANQRISRLSQRLLGVDITLAPPEVKVFSPAELARVEQALQNTPR